MPITPANGGKREHSLSKFIYVMCDKRQRCVESGTEAVPFMRVVADNRRQVDALKAHPADKNTINIEGESFSNGHRGWLRSRRFSTQAACDDTGA
jgi:hypothetical protein